MRILITNDDSIHAPGIALLTKAASAFGRVTVVAPEHECSAMSQKLTLRDPMELRQVPDYSGADTAYALDGTPVDCVKVALEYILEEKPDWVLSGINNGYNAGYDIAYSGTLGAAFEAARAGVPAIALSVARDIHLDCLELHLSEVLRELFSQPPEPGSVWNVNFPPLRTKPLAGTLRDRIPAPTSMYREHYTRHLTEDGRVLLDCVGSAVEDSAIPAGTDARAVRDGYISIGKVRSAPL